MELPTHANQHSALITGDQSKSEALANANIKPRISPSSPDARLEVSLASEAAMPSCIQPIRNGQVGGALTWLRLRPTRHGRNHLGSSFCKT